MTKWTKGNIFLILVVFIFMFFPTINVKAIESESSHKHIYSYDDFKSKSVIVKTDKLLNFKDYGVIDSNYIDNEIVTLYFDSVDKAINCYEQLKDKEYIEFIEPDMYIDISEDNTIEEVNKDNNLYNSWGVESLAIDKYIQYIKDENIDNIVTIAVIDSGIDYNHPIFKDKLLPKGYDFINNDEDPYDDDIQGHGTHVAGIIADATRDISNIKIMPLKALNTIGRGTISSVANSIKYAIDSGVDIINLSLGFITGIHSKLIEEMIIEAIESGVTVVNAAGNYNSNTMNSCPSHIDQAIIVSSIDNNNNKAYTSNYGPNIDVAAPGVGIYSAAPGGNYVYKNGTSMAAPHISVIAAMLKLNNPDLKPFEIENLIKEYSIDIGEKGVDWYFGSGVPDMTLALPKVPLEDILTDKDKAKLYEEDKSSELNNSNEENLIVNKDIDKKQADKEEDVVEKEIRQDKNEKSVELLYLDNSYKAEKIEELDTYNENNINDEEIYRSDLNSIDENNEEVIIAYEKDIEENIVEDEQSSTKASEKVEKTENNNKIFIGVFLVVSIFIANKLYKRLKR